MTYHYFEVARAGRDARLLEQLKPATRVIQRSAQTTKYAAGHQGLAKDEARRIASNIAMIFSSEVRNSRIRSIRMVPFWGEQTDARAA
jgi:hypothetical protein